MRIDCRIESDGTPILFFPDDVNDTSKMIGCYARIGQHNEASRAYMRQCKKPQTSDEFKACNSLIFEWAKQPF